MAEGSRGAKSPAMMATANVASKVRSPRVHRSRFKDRLSRFELALRGFLQNLGKTGGHLISHPGDITTVPRWFRERRASTMDLRQPWWPYAMTAYVESVLPASARVFEYGGGGSSLWLADRGAHVTTVEHDSGWDRQLRRVVPPRQVELLLVPPSESGQITSATHDGFFDDYVGSIDSYSDDIFDLVIVDGRARVECAMRARQKLKRGGMILLDDSDRPRYAAAVRALDAWPSRSVEGLKVGSSIPARTTIWTRPH